MMLVEDGEADIEPLVGSWQEPDDRAPSVPEDDRFVRLVQQGIARLARSNESAFSINPTKFGIRKLGATRRHGFNVGKHEPD